MFSTNANLSGPYSQSIWNCELSLSVWAVFGSSSNRYVILLSLSTKITKPKWAIPIIPASIILEIYVPKQIPINSKVFRMFQNTIKTMKVNLSLKFTIPCFAPFKKCPTFKLQTPACARIAKGLIFIGINFHCRQIANKSAPKNKSSDPLTYLNFHNYVTNWKKLGFIDTKFSFTNLLR